MENKILFDESVFKSGSLFVGLPSICVYNNADQFLVKRLGLDTSLTAGVHLNPDKPTIGLNVYSMRTWPNHVMSKVVSLQMPNIITVGMCSSDSRPIDCDEYDSTVVYTINPYMTTLESAIMLKFYAINFNNVRASAELRALVDSYFDADRDWFSTENCTLIFQHPNKQKFNEHGKDVILPPLNFYDPEMMVF